MLAGQWTHTRGSALGPGRHGCVSYSRRCVATFASDARPSAAAARENCTDADGAVAQGRRAVLAGVAALLPAACVLGARVPPAAADVAKYEPMDALKGKDYGKPRMTYKDYTMTESGLQYQDIKVGDGDSPAEGDLVIIDWDGYTIGYYGRPFEARNKPKGSSFNDDNKDFYRFVLGEHKVIPAFEEAVASMKPGGIRRIIVPVELGYPDNDWRKLGPKPSTFAGDRALDFVLNNRGMIDKTLLFDIELMRVQRK